MLKSLYNDYIVEDSFKEITKFKNYNIYIKAS